MTMPRLEIPDLTPVMVNKQCRKCGDKWRGKFFKSWVADAPRVAVGEKQYVLAYCDGCIDLWEREQLRYRLETDVDTLDSMLRTGPTKAKQVRLLRSKVTVLTNTRATYDPGVVMWAKLTDRIQEVNATIRKLDK